GCVRADHPAAARHPPLPAYALLLPDNLAHLEVSRLPRSQPQNERDAAGFFRSDFITNSGRRVGRQRDRHATQFLDRHLPERHDVLYSRPWRRRSPLGTRAPFDRRRIGIRLWISCRGDRLSSVHLRLVLEARSEHFAARCARRYSSHRGRTAPAPRIRIRTGSAGGTLEGMGALERRTYGESSFLSRSRLLSVAA